MSAYNLSLVQNEPHGPSELAAHFDWAALNSASQLPLDATAQLLFNFLAEKGLVMEFVGYAHSKLEEKTGNSPA